MNVGSAIDIGNFEHADGDTGRGHTGYSPESAASQGSIYNGNEAKACIELRSNQDLEAKETPPEPEAKPAEQEIEVQKEVEVLEKGKGEEVSDTQEESEFNYSVTSMLRRYVLVNSSSALVNCQIGIFPKSNDFLNFRIPMSFFSVAVKPKSNTPLLSLVKIFPNMDWGDFEVRCHIQKIDQPTGSPKDDNDSGRKQGASFNIKPIDLSSSKRHDADDDGTHAMMEEDFYGYPY